MLGELDDPLLVGATNDEGPRTVGHDLLDRHDLAGPLRGADLDDVERFVQDDLGTADELVGLDRRVGLDAHLAAAREHVGRAIGVETDQGAVRARGLRELVDLFAKRGDVLARLAQRVGELLVLADGLCELALGVEEALFEGAHAFRGVL